MAVHALASKLADIPVFRAKELKAAPSCGSWDFDRLAGILSEISEETSAGAASFAAEIILDAQQRGEPVAWVAGTDSVFFPPDMADRGVDVPAVAVVRAGGASESLVAAEWLARSGAIGLVVVDTGGHGKVDDAALGRILKHAERGRCAVVFLTRKAPREPSLGSRISLRGCITRSPGTPLCMEILTVKDKRSNSVSRLSRRYRGHPGMRQY